jgi:hypothetical protein
MPFPELRRRLGNQTLHRGLSKRKNSLKKLPNVRNATNKITTRIMNFRTRFMKNKCPNQHQQVERQIIDNRLYLNFFTSATSFKVKWLFTLMTLVPSTLPFLSSLKVTYSLRERGVRLENHFLSPVMCLEQLESINHLFSRTPSITYIE